MYAPLLMRMRPSVMRHGTVSMAKTEASFLK
jgi:hypothetical protein